MSRRFLGDRDFLVVDAGLAWPNNGFQMKRKQKNQQDLSKEEPGGSGRDRCWQDFFDLADEIRVPKDFLVERGDGLPQERTPIPSQQGSLIQKC